MNCQQCNKEAKWVDNGPRLQYYYCTDCKIEVNDKVEAKDEDKDYSDNWLFYSSRPSSMKVQPDGSILWENTGDSYLTIPYDMTLQINGLIVWEAEGGK